MAKEINYHGQNFSEILILEKFSLTVSSAYLLNSPPYFLALPYNVQSFNQNKQVGERK